MDWKKIKSNYPLAIANTYLDNARTGAMSKGTATVLKAHIDDFVNNGALHREDWIETKNSARKRVSDILEAEESSIGFLTDVSTGMSFLTSAMDQDQRVLLIRDDFPSTAIPWIRSGYKITWIDKEKDLTIDLDKIENALRGNIDLMVISWVQYNSGFRVDLERLSQLTRQYGVKLIVDGTQGFCAIPVSPAQLGIDVFMASCFKWATAGYGLAVLYINPEFRKSLHFGIGGWNSLLDFFGSLEEGENYKHSPEFVEIGHPKYANLITLDHALGELQEIGLNNIQERTRHLSSYLQTKLKEASIETLSNFSPEESSGIRLMRGDKELFRRLETQNIKFTFREDYFRLATYFYNDEEDVDRFVSHCTP